MSEPDVSKFGLEMACEFVPFSKAEKWEPSKPGGKPPLTITHRCTITKQGREVWSGEFQRGVGHLPGGLGKARPTVMVEEERQRACETGRFNPSFGFMPTKTVPPPSLVEVLACLVGDASAIDHPSFEDWADEYGYDKDSRKGEAIYRKCLETGLKLRAALGDAGLAELRETLADY